ncbi:hypothetical protein Tco_1427163, partial [Tanacetum coccineum]
MKMEILPESTSNSTEVAEYNESNTYVLERFNTARWNPIKEILLNLNLPDHKSILTDSKIYIKIEWRYLVLVDVQDKSRFIATCSYSTNIYKDIMKAQIQRISLIGFPAQSVGSSNTDVLDSPRLLVLNTRMSQSRQH